MRFKKTIYQGIEYLRLTNGKIMAAAGQQNCLTVGIFSQQCQRDEHIPDFPAAANGQHGEAQLLIFRVLGQIQGAGRKPTEKQKQTWP